MGYEYSPIPLNQDFLIYISGSNYVAVNGTTGRRIITSTSLSTVIAACESIADPRSSYYFKSGVYTVDATLEFVDRNVGFFGAGTTNTIFTLANGVDDDVININGTGFYYPHLAYFRIFGNKTNQATGNGIVIDHYAKQFHLDSVEVYDCKDNGMVFGTGTATGFDGFINHCCSELNDNYGVLIDRMDRINITGGYVYANLIGIVLDRTTHRSAYTRISAVDISNNKTNGMLINKADRTAITGCTFCTNNQDSAATTYDIKVVDCGGLSIVGNVFHSANATYNIYCSASAKQVIINGNTTSEYATGFLDIHSTARIIAGVNYEDKNYAVQGIKNAALFRAESANAETPQLTYPVGSIVDFTDSGDGSGDGIYILDNTLTWVKID